MHGAPAAGAPYYRYDPHLGSPRDKYTRVDFTTTASHQPELPGRFAAVVEGEYMMSSMRGRVARPWRAEPGTACLILGYWSDGSVHLKWPALANNYMVDGRFPAWVVTEDPDAEMAHGGFILRANELRLTPVRLVPRRTWVVISLAILVVLLLWPPTRDAIAYVVRSLTG